MEQGLQQWGSQFQAEETGPHDTLGVADTASNPPHSQEDSNTPLEVEDNATMAVRKKIVSQKRSDTAEESTFVFVSGDERRAGHLQTHIPIHARRSFALEVWKLAGIDAAGLACGTLGHAR